MLGGLISEKYNKTIDPDLLSQFDNDDIVLLTETHVEYNNILTFDHYNYYPFCRDRSKNNRHFGGLGILIRKDIKRGVKFLNNGTSEYQ